MVNNIYIFFQAHNESCFASFLNLSNPLEKSGLVHCYRDIFIDPHIHTLHELRRNYLTRNDICLIF